MRRRWERCVSHSRPFPCLPSSISRTRTDYLSIWQRSSSPSRLVRKTSTSRETRPPLWLRRARRRSIASEMDQYTASLSYRRESEERRRQRGKSRRNTANCSVPATFPPSSPFAPLLSISIPAPPRRLPPRPSRRRLLHPSTSSSFATPALVV